VQSAKGATTFFLVANVIAGLPDLKSK
jgi:hypothetical protein